MIVELLTAKRSFSNESAGKGMYGCLAKNGVVVCYFSTKTAFDEHGEKLKSTLENDDE